MKDKIKEEMTREPERKYYFIAGLPRSGSTLLSAILNQNPKFYSGPSSPVPGLMVSIENMIASDQLFLAFPKPQQAGEIIANVLKYYYSDVPTDKSVIFEKNRSWPSRVHYIKGYFGFQPKILCLVRDLDEILASFLAMHKRSPYQINGKINFIDEMLVKMNIPLSDENRCKFLASPEGIIGESYNSMKKALSDGYGDALHFIEYNDLISNPEETMRRIYEFLGQEYYEHTFDNLVNPYREKDEEMYGFSDMHEVRTKLEKSNIDPKEILPKEIQDMCVGSEFWRTTNQSTFFGEVVVEDEAPSNKEEASPASLTNFIGE